MAISREEFEQIRAKLGSHTSWAVWAPQGHKPTSNISDLSIFNDEEKIPATLMKLNPDIVLAGLNGSTGVGLDKIGVNDFENFHSGYSRATDFKIRFATVGTPLEGDFMTAVIKHHYETDSTKVATSLRQNPSYERAKVEEFFNEISLISNCPTIFAFGSMAYDLIQKYNQGRFTAYKLYHYAYTMSKENFRDETLKTLKLAGFI